MKRKIVTTLLLTPTLMFVVLSLVLMACSPTAVHHTATTNHHVPSTFANAHVAVPVDCRIEHYDTAPFTDAICWHSYTNLPGKRYWLTTNCYTEDLDNHHNAVATLRAQGHHVSYRHHWWYVDSVKAVPAPTEDSPTTLCQSYPVNR